MRFLAGSSMGSIYELDTTVVNCVIPPYMEIRTLRGGTRKT